MDLQSFITAALSTGCGAIIQWLFSAYAKDRAEDGEPISPKTKRRVVMGLCALVPSALVVILYLITAQYDWQQHIMAVGLAFVSSQAIHGETKLEDGKQMRTRMRKEAIAKEGGA